MESCKDFDAAEYYNPEDFEANDKEGYIKITKDGNTIEVHTINNMRKTKGLLIVNGNRETIDAKVYDSKVYADYSILDKMNKLTNTNDYSLTGPSDTSSQNHFPVSLFNQIIQIPLWVFIILILALIVFVVVLIAFVVRNKKTKNNN